MQSLCKVNLMVKIYLLIYPECSQVLIIFKGVVAVLEKSHKEK